MRPHTPPPRPTPGLEHLPLPLFAAVMGLAGLALVWRAAGVHWAFAPAVSQVIAIAAMLVMAALVAAYGCKALGYPHGPTPTAEDNHNVSCAGATSGQ